MSRIVRLGQTSGIHIRMTNPRPAEFVQITDNLFSRGSGIKHRSILVEVRSYFPNVECHDILTPLGPSYNSCKDLLDAMLWSETLVSFGFPWQVRLFWRHSFQLSTTLKLSRGSNGASLEQPGVQFAVPEILISGELKRQLCPDFSGCIMS